MIDYVVFNILFKKSFIITNYSSKKLLKLSEDPNNNRQTFTICKWIIFLVDHANN